MEDKTWLDYLTAIGAVATPLVVIFLSAVGWKYKSSIERKNELNNKLRDDRIEIYNSILEPFIIILLPDAVWEADKKNKNKDKTDVAVGKMLTLDYRKQGFKLSLMGSDDVVKSYNNLMQYFYNAEDNKPSNNEHFLHEMLSLLGTLLLEIRKSMGNEATSLDNWDMCEWWMKDARKIKSGRYR